MAKVHLVLGAGGARGMAHIGVIEELEKEGHEIIDVVGCSMGAVVGGIYAAGYLKEYKDWLLTLSKSAVWGLLDFTFTSQGFLKGEKVFATILEMTGPLKIEDLNIPFIAVAAEVRRKEEVVFNSGDLYQALRASISIPGIFTPIINKNQVLVDGGILNPLPLNLVKRQEDAIIVAVNINAPEPLKDKQDIDKTEDKQEKQDSWLPLSWPFGKKNDNEDESSFSLLNLMQTSYDCTQDRLTDLMIETYKPEIVIDITRSTCGIFDFHKAQEIIDLGRLKYAECAVPRDTRKSL